MSTDSTIPLYSLKILLLQTAQLTGCCFFGNRLYNPCILTEDPFAPDCTINWRLFMSTDSTIPLYSLKILLLQTAQLTGCCFFWKQTVQSLYTH